jgi:hypothetical protein
MAIDLSKLRKLETPSASVQSRQPSDDEKMVVLVKLRQGFARPSYLVPRGEISAAMFSTEVPASALQRIESDPAVESVSISKLLPSIR